MKKFLAGLVSLLMLSTAFAEPTITHLGYTAYLGSSNELYLQDPTGTVRVLRYPIADILSITDTVSTAARRMASCSALRWTARSR